MTTFAAIDIGTHSILLLVGAPQPDGTMRVLDERSSLPRLGEKLKETGRLADAAMERAIIVLKEYRQAIDTYAVTDVAIVGTEALRRASNASAFLARIKQETTFEVEVISGPREAALTFAAAAHDFGNDIAVIDIGGGSTEVIRLVDPKNFTSGITMVSMPMGSVVLTEMFLRSDPVTDAEELALRNYIQDILTSQTGPARRTGPIRLIATAGTATTVAAVALRLTTYDQAKVHGFTITRDQIASLLTTLKERTIAERKKIPGLHPQRADVILAGATILALAMDHFHHPEVMVSDRGVRWGLFYERYGLTPRV
ncbi:MAG: hypothetical protein HY465_04335 [Deltaproteobacteria bacterium]|nr:hypothetical protein [Deltaproteobacteria bacterium]